MRREKKINPHAQAPRLIEKVQRDLRWTQTDLERVLGMSQQAVSDYALGYVAREQYGVIEKLKEVLAKKLPPPPKNPGEVINDEQANGSTSGALNKKGKAEAKARRVSSVQARRIKGHRGKTA